jgi:hypothetical protein
MHATSLIRQSILLCFAAGLSFTAMADTPSDNFKPAYNVQGLDTQFIDIPPEKKVTSIDMNLLGLKDTVVSFRERHQEDLFEVLCITKKPFFGKAHHSLVCVNELKELGEKHTFDGQNFGNFMDEPTVINVEPGFKVTKINFDVDIGSEPTFEVDRMLDSDFPEVYTLVRIDPQTNAWNGSRQFVVKEGANPKE